MDRCREIETFKERQKIEGQKDRQADRQRKTDRERE